MPALDQCHDQIVRALEKAGWLVQPGPFIIPITGVRRLFIDIYARRQSNGRDAIIVVEAKCFSDPKTELGELYTAIGQYLIYQNLLTQKGASEILYLALPTHAFHGIVQQLAMPMIREIGIKMVIVNLEQEEIERWSE